jgi:hypothetical protein
MHNNICKPLIHISSMAVLALALTACGGGSDSTNGNGPASNSLSGTAATGAAIASGTVTAKCVTGTTSGTTAADGSFTLSLSSGQTAPCILQVTKAGTPAIELYGFATAAGHVNITPLTDMVLSNATQDSPAVAFNNFDAAHVSTITTGLVAAKAYVLAQLAGTTLGTPTGDLLTGTFAVGDANDHVLDHLATAMTTDHQSITDLRILAAGGHTLSGIIPSALPSTAAGDKLLSGFLGNVVNGTYTTSGMDAGNAACGTHTLVVAEGSVTVDGTAFLDASHNGRVEVNAGGGTTALEVGFSDLNQTINYNLWFNADGSIASIDFLSHPGCTGIRTGGPAAVAQFNLATIVKRYARTETLTCNSYNLGSVIHTGPSSFVASTTDGSLTVTGSGIPDALGITPTQVNTAGGSTNLVDGDLFGTFGSNINMISGKHSIGLAMLTAGTTASVDIAQDKTSNASTTCTP